MGYISIAKDFSETPFGRFPSDGPNSAERFRQELLVPEFKKSGSEEVIVDFSGVALGIGSSFLEEAFGGLIRVEGFKQDEILCRLKIQTKLPIYKNQILKFLSEAVPGKVSG
ncbi:STAS-like domain-containing protein [Yersinia ruckeri]|uniref:STAS-like domain-containing protein n=1 Tax=Yersinia ruckeri TaxID=29486 RepID=UPI0009C14C93|nr:STAS-like domain-containing protein [Yersinia ruckeri]HDL6924824.1 STAS-like domain-containing protein [Yersinia enterocolitica]EKN4696362.1 STAS-like domain-containing protein [Yersinia ruckeri]MCK8543179.1 STAS-like domain-containing protein [Yersinia ruckeri]MCK8552786.1 STAS-like domain-containing protein [Yersinia ruckeri]MCW6519784.1 STAS-like domain-containing protein [Yersinia ruckeri]